MVVYPIIFRVLYIPGGAGFQPSTVGRKHKARRYIFPFAKFCMHDDLRAIRLRPTGLLFEG